MVWICRAAVFVLAVIASTKVEAQVEQRLWGASKAFVFSTLKNFVLSPGVQPELNFVNVEKVVDGDRLLARFVSVPKGWHTFEGQETNCYNLLLDHEGVWLGIRIDMVGGGVAENLAGHMQANGGHHGVVIFDQMFLSDGTKVPRIVRCEEGKGSTAFQEYRYFTTGKRGAIYVGLTAGASRNEDFDSLLRVLRTHYGKYEAVCQEVAHLLVQGK